MMSRGRVTLINARKLGTMPSRRHASKTRRWAMMLMPRAEEKMMAAGSVEARRRCALAGRHCQPSCRHFSPAPTKNITSDTPSRRVRRRVRRPPPANRARPGHTPLYARRAARAPGGGAARSSPPSAAGKHHSFSRARARAAAHAAEQRCDARRRRASGQAGRQRDAQSMIFFRERRRSEAEVIFTLHCRCFALRQEGDAAAFRRVRSAVRLSFLSRVMYRIPPHGASVGRHALKASSTPSGFLTISFRPA